jgi:flavin reductase
VAPCGSPRITDAVASFDCAVDQVIEAGTHLVCIGRVRVVLTTPGTPLIFTGRRYWRPEPFARRCSPSSPTPDPTAWSRRSNSHDPHR